MRRAFVNNISNLTLSLYHTVLNVRVVFFLYSFVPGLELHPLSMCRHEQIWPRTVCFVAGPSSLWQRDLQSRFVFQSGLKGAPWVPQRHA